MSSKTAFIGLGVMGYPMAGHLKKAGHEVTVYNRTASKAEQWVEEFGGLNGFRVKDLLKYEDIQESKIEITRKKLRQIIQEELDLQEIDSDGDGELRCSSALPRCPARDS